MTRRKVRLRVVKRVPVTEISLLCPDCGEPFAGRGDGFPVHVPGCGREHSRRSA